MNSEQAELRRYDVMYRTAAHGADCVVDWYRRVRAAETTPTPPFG
jgi:hypothetical protein